MPNINISRVVFEGNPGTLEQIQNLITKKQNNKNTLSYELVETLVPDMKDKELFKSWGCDYDKYILQKDMEYTQHWHGVFLKYLKDHNYIGSRDEFINDRIFKFKTNIHKEQLIIDMEMAWYCPMGFFTNIADNYEIPVYALDKTEGNYTHVVYKDKNEYQETPLTMQAAINNINLLHATLKLNHFRVPEVAIAYYVDNKIDLYRAIAEKYTPEQLIHAIDKNISLLECDPYCESILFERRTEEDKEIIKESLNDLKSNLTNIQKASYNFKKLM